ncbi:MAG: aldehyde dehydrogenase family protein, partial [Kordiimonadaceae bacterium]|nr:aldehyde dehydrogenase family protein [Kordiimonadaceae bacterium]
MMMKKHDNLIGGEWVSFGNYMPNINPSNMADVIGTYSYGDAASVDAAVDAAKAAQGGWADVTPQVRHDLLEAVGNKIAARKEEIGRLLSREEGKTLAEGMGETMRASQVFKFFAGEALRQVGDFQASVRPDIDVETTREPMGIIGLVTPWNFPIAIPAWKIAPALAFGNCVILKPADLTPGCAHIIAEILHECGCPPGVFNLVMGRGSIVGEAIVTHKDIDAVSFTGSVTTGNHIAEVCGKMQKKVQLEMGGKNPMVVLDDADLSLAVPACINGTFFSTGQRCTASSRMIVQAGIYDAFVEAMTKALADIKVGDALDPATQIGPVVDEKQLNANLKYVELAREEGARVIG